jgi:flagellar biosynthesis/type III secretory pathway ATPase
VTQQFSQYVEKTTNKIQELLEQVRDEDDITKVSEIYDQVANHADKAASQLSQITNLLDGKDEQDENDNEMNTTLQKSAKESNRGGREREKVGSR